MAQASVVKDARVQAEIERLDTLREHQLDSDLKKLAALPEAQRVFFWLVDELAGINGLSWTPTGNTTTFFNEGRRDVGIAFAQRWQKVAPETYVRALQVELNRRTQEQKAVDALTLTQDEQREQTE